jgi:isocitrate/isopropylmalate dehydrogenase
MLLRHIGEQEASDRVEAATAEVLADGTWVTFDLREPDDDRPAAGTYGVADAIVAKL